MPHATLRDYAIISMLFLMLILLRAPCRADAIDAAGCYDAADYAIA